jgi:hypothetical protein
MPLPPLPWARLDHELLLAFDDLREVADLGVARDQAVELRKGDPCLGGELLGLRLVVDEREEPARILGLDQAEVALVHAEDALLAEHGPRPAEPPAHEGSPLPIQTLRKRQNSSRR